MLERVLITIRNAIILENHNLFCNLNSHHGLLYLLIIIMNHICLNIYIYRLD